MSEETIKDLEVVQVEKQMQSLAPVTIEASIYTSPTAFEHVQRVAQVFAKSSQLVPAAYRGNFADCVIAVETSNQLGIHPLIFMQNSSIIHGKPSLDGKLIIALMNTRGPFKQRIKFDYSGEKHSDNRSVRAWTVHSDDDAIIYEEMSVADAKRWGWYDRKDSAWRKDSDLMLAYRSATFLCRKYCPELLMGFVTADEARDIGPEQSTIIERLKVS